MGAANRSGGDDTFDLSYSDTQGWTINGPGSVTVTDGDLVAFTFDVEIPISANCSDVDVVTVNGVGQGDPSLVDSATATITVFCPTGVGGLISDANTSMPVPGAYIYLEQIGNPDNFGEGFANVNGEYLITELTPGNYYLGVSAEGYQWSVLPDGWPVGADQVAVVQDNVTLHDVDLNAPVMVWSADSYTVTLDPGEVFTPLLTITNDGTAPLYVNIGNYADNMPLQPNIVPGRTPDFRIDPRILSDLDLDGTADFIAVMTEQADLSVAYSIQDWETRGQYVYERLLETANRSQEALRDQLEQEGLNYRSFLTSNSLLVYDANRDLVNRVATRSDIAYLLANAEIELVEPKVDAPELSPEALTWGVQAVNADDVWTDEGVTGEGIVVANIDTGVFWTHPALEEQYRGGLGDHDYNWYMPTSGCPGQTEPCDNDGHGTHTMGTIVGSTDPSDPINATEGIGVAPGAEWIACKGCEFNSCSFEALLACGDWITAPTDLNGQNPDPSKRPNVVNNSWGGGGGDFWYGGVVGAWRAAGIFPQFSAGNSGPGCGTTGSPGDYAMSFGAAALQDDGGGNYSAAGFSSRGPAAISGILQPNISAPGVAVRSSIPGGGYANAGGTSMASPHVAGVVALLWSAQPELNGQIENTMNLLSETAQPLFTTDGCGGDDDTSHPNHTYGFGLVDAAAAVTNADGVVLPWLEVIPSGIVLAPGESVEVALVMTAPLQEGIYTGTLHLSADEPYNPVVSIPLTLISEEPTKILYLPIILKQPEP
jgi:subtilisin family serine protease